MATKKITITLPEDLLALIRKYAAEEGLPVSTWIARVAEHRARTADGRVAMSEWEAEYGPPSEDAVKWADEQITKAEAALRTPRDQADKAHRVA